MEEHGCHQGKIEDSQKIKKRRGNKSKKTKVKR
jgi:hypothetical protein